VPELPEVETIKRELNKKVLGWTFVDVWSDSKKQIKKPENFEQFKKEISGKKIKKIKRRGKYVLFELSENKTLLIHQKLTGHLLVGKWKFKNGKWLPPPGPLSEKINTYIHLLFTFKNGQMLALSDLRKFAKIELWDSRELEKSGEMKSLGPEPLEKDFTFAKFKECLKNKKGKIKQILMDQTVISGIGNIYSDEILWEAKIHPFKDVSKLSEADLKRIYEAMRKILKKAVEVGGESISDFRRTTGERGGFDPLRKVYRREGEKCFRCGTIIKRVKIGGRSAHFCPKCQKLT
jgi:formamidopyrimidine-DNA glycosylase